MFLSFKRMIEFLIEFLICDLQTDDTLTKLTVQLKSESAPIFTG